MVSSAPDYLSNRISNRSNPARQADDARRSDDCLTSRLGPKLAPNWPAGVQQSKAIWTLRAVALVVGFVASCCSATITFAQSPLKAEVTETQSAPYQAEIASISTEAIAIQTGGAAKQVPADRLLRVRLSRPSTEASAAERPQSLTRVELTDGSEIACTSLTSDGKIVTLTWPDGSAATLSTKSIAHCLLKPLAPTQQSQAKAILESAITTDVLLLIRAEQNVDKIEGLIGKIDQKNLQFTLDGQDLPVALTKLAGFRYFSAATDKRNKLVAVVRDARGNVWMAHKINWNAADKAAQLTLVCGAQVAVPADMLSELDFSFGSMRFLADLTPLDRKTTPRFALSVALPESEKLFGPQPAAAASQRGAVVGPGIDFLGSGSITYRIPDDFKRLAGTVELATQGPKFVPCKVQVLQEDQVLFEKTLSKQLESFPVDLAIEPGKRLRLVVTAEGDSPLGDFVAWRQLRFVK